MQWEIDRILQSADATHMKPIPKGWEPFAITKEGSNGYWIWLRKKKSCSGPCYLF